MELKLYDTMTKEKRVFTPLDPDNVRMYVCGPTVYDDAHIGNARPVIVFDVLFRLLRHVYGEKHVTYVRNITDVDDKINARAAERGISIRELTEQTNARFQADTKALGCLEPTAQPRATEHIDAMRAMIETLVERGCAYVAQDHVLFAVASMKTYGRLARRSLDEMMAGARVEVAPYKRDAMDFVLWKPSKDGEPGWDSPCGIKVPGRPGWHVECSAMSMVKLLEPSGGGLSCDDPLKNTFDIHGGGIDLVFPHHENEIAQSCCALGTQTMAQVWMHNGFLQVEGEKMSKSLGNFLTIRELLDEWPGDVLRLQMLMTHYRQPIDWTRSRCEDACFELLEWSTLLEGQYSRAQSQPSQEVVAALADDLATPNAITAIRQLYKSAKDGDFEALGRLAASCKILGFLKLDYPGLFEQGVSGLDIEPAALFENADDVQELRSATANNVSQSNMNEIRSRIERRGFGIEIDAGMSITLVRGNRTDTERKIEDLVAARAAARARKDFKESDRIRDELAAMGVVLKDGKDENGNPVTTWEIAR